MFSDSDKNKARCVLAEKGAGLYNITVHTHIININHSKQHICIVHKKITVQIWKIKMENIFFLSS